jgi:hypothetical protein
MKKRLSPLRRRSVGASMSLLLIVGAAACSSDSKSSSTTSSAGSDTTTAASPPGTAGAGTSTDDVRAVTTRIVVEAGKVGYTLDEACVAKLVATLPKDDLTALADAAADTTPGATTPALSAAGDEIGSSILKCSKGSSNQDLIDQAAAVVLGQESTSSLDPACIKKQLATLSDEQLQLIIDSGPESTDPRLGAAAYALFDCVGLTDTTTANS